MTTHRLPKLQDAFEASKDPITYTAQQMRPRLTEVRVAAAVCMGLAVVANVLIVAWWLLSALPLPRRTGVYTSTRPG